jgi:hypothetical protein
MWSRIGYAKDDDPVPNCAGFRGGDDVFFTGMHDDGDQDFLEGQLVGDLRWVHPVEHGVVPRSGSLPGEIEAHTRPIAGSQIRWHKVAANDAAEGHGFGRRTPAVGSIMCSK